MITDNLKRLNTRDIYSMLLFVMFKMKQLPEQAALSELIYILDREPLLKLCEFYGGTTLYIPTIEELEVLVYCLIVYNDVMLEHKDLDKVLDKLPIESYLLKQVREKYLEVAEILNDYEFFPR